VTPPSAPSESTDRLVADVTCLGCGCACDDIRVTVRDGRIVEAARACELGVAWFGSGLLPKRGRGGHPAATMDTAIASAGRTRARRAPSPRVPGTGHHQRDAREGIALADAIGAALDSVTSDTAMGAILAAQGTRPRVGHAGGGAAARRRRRVVGTRSVRPLSALRRAIRAAAARLHVPDGRASRTVIRVDIGTAVARPDADRRFLLPAEDEVATLSALRALVSTPLGETAPHDGDPVRAAIWARARSLAPALVSGQYVLVVADAEAPDATGSRADAHVRLAALIALVQALNGPTRAALSLLRAGGNRSGIDAVMTSQTGYPAAVDFLARRARATSRSPAGRRAWPRVVKWTRRSSSAISTPCRRIVSAFVTTVPSVVIGPDASAMTLDPAASRSTPVWPASMMGARRCGSTTYRCRCEPCSPARRRPCRS
jgi:formylmethanofuran dehydrogenase subunit B